MQVGDRNREKTEQDAARAALAGNHGGPLGLMSVKEIRIACPGSPSLARWREFLTPDYPEAGAGPSLRFVEGPHGALTALVLRVASAPKAKAFLESIDSERILTAGVRIICVE